jgi:ATP-dependent Clp protease ATP-binding subunit ClpC
MDWIKSFWESSSKGPDKAWDVALMDCFTPRAKRVFELAREEAESFHHNIIGMEHLLLGIIKLGQGIAANVLKFSGLNFENVRKEFEKQVGLGNDQGGNNIRPTPRVMKVLSMARVEAKALTDTHIGTGHILLGMLREMRQSDSTAARVLKNLQVDVEKTRQMILKEHHSNSLSDDNEQNGPD